MTRKLFGIALFSLMATAAVAEPLSGTYVEARSLSVWAGACHYNAEVSTAGREAIVAWSFSHGDADGVALAGVRAVAVVAGDGNLADASTARRSVLYLDAGATAAQREAAARLIRRRAAALLGNVIDVRAAKVDFQTGATSIRIAAGDAQLDARPYKCAHCRMPAQLWYRPFDPGAHAEVAQGVRTGYKESRLGVAWSHEPADNVFFGSFSW